MSSQYDGIYLNVTLPTPVAIQSTTDATPIVVQTSSAHGLTDKDVVDITGHFVNTTANGIWGSVTVIDATHFSLPGSVGAGHGAGGANGHVQLLNFGATMAIPSDGDAEAAATFDVAYEALADRSVITFFGCGAYKLVASGSLGTTIAGVTTGSRIGDTIPPSLAFVNHGSGSGLAQMDDSIADPASWIIGGLNSGDILEIMFDGTGQLIGTGGANYKVSFALGYQFTHTISGGSYAATLTSPSFGPSKLMSSPGSSALEYSPMSLRAMVTVPTFDDGSFGGMCYIAPFCNVNGSGSATGQFVGDYLFYYRVWRKTFIPQ